MPNLTASCFRILPAHGESGLDNTDDTNIRSCISTPHALLAMPSNRLERLRSKHQKLRDESIEKLEESRQILGIDGAAEPPDGTISAVGVDLVGLSTFSFDLSLPNTSALPQHGKITVEEENERLKQQLGMLKLEKEVTRSQQRREEEAAIRKLKETSSFELNERLRKELADITADRDRLKHQVDVKVAQQWQSQKEKIERIQQQVSIVEKQLLSAQSNHRQRQAHNETEAHRILELLGGLEIRDPDSQKQLLELKEVLHSWTKSGKVPKRQRLSASKVDVLTAETEAVIWNLQKLRTKLNETDDANEEMIQKLEEQIEQQLHRWNELEKRMDQFTEPEPAPTTTRTIATKHTADVESISLQAKKLQVRLQEMRTITNRNADRRKEAAQNPSDVDAAPDANDRWFSSFFTPENAMPKNTAQRPIRNEQPRTGYDTENCTPDEEPFFSSFFPAPQTGTGMVVPVEASSTDAKADRVEGVEEISGESPPSNSSGEDYYPASKMEILGTIFEFATRNDDSGSSNSTDVHSLDNYDEEDEFQMSIEDLMLEGGLFTIDTMRKESNQKDALSSESKSFGSDYEIESNTGDESAIDDGTPKLANRKRIANLALDQDDTAASKNSTEGHGSASNSFGSAEFQQGDERTSKPVVNSSRPMTSRSDSNLSAGRNRDAGNRVIGRTESDGSAFEVASIESDGENRHQVDLRIPEHFIHWKRTGLNVKSNRTDASSGMGEEDGEAKGSIGSTGDSSGYEVASNGDASNGKPMVVATQNVFINWERVGTKFNSRKTSASRSSDDHGSSNGNGASGGVSTREVLFGNASFGSDFEVASNEGADTVERGKMEHGSLEVFVEWKRVEGKFHQQSSIGSTKSNGKTVPARSQGHDDSKDSDGSEGVSSNYEVASNQGDDTDSKVAQQASIEWNGSMTMEAVAAACDNDGSSSGRHSEHDDVASLVEGSHSGSSYVVSLNQGFGRNEGEVKTLSREGWVSLRLQENSSPSAYDSSDSIENMIMPYFGTSDSDTSSYSQSFHRSWHFGTGHATIDSLLPETREKWDETSMYEDHISQSAHEQASLSESDSKDSSIEFSVEKMLAASIANARELQLSGESAVGSSHSNSSSQNMLSQSKTDLMKAMLSEYGSSSEDSSLADSALKAESQAKTASNTYAVGNVPNGSGDIETVAIPSASAVDIEKRDLLIEVLSHSKTAPMKDLVSEYGSSSEESSLAGSSLDSHNGAGNSLQIVAYGEVPDETRDVGGVQGIHTEGAVEASQTDDPPNPLSKSQNELMNEMVKQFGSSLDEESSQSSFDAIGFLDGSVRRGAAASATSTRGSKPTATSNVNDLEFYEKEKESFDETMKKDASPLPLESIASDDNQKDHQQAAEVTSGSVEDAVTVMVEDTTDKSSGPFKWFQLGKKAEKADTTPSDEPHVEIQGTGSEDLPEVHAIDPILSVPGLTSGATGSSEEKGQPNPESPPNDAEQQCKPLEPLEPLELVESMANENVRAPKAPTASATNDAANAVDRSQAKDEKEKPMGSLRWFFGKNRGKVDSVLTDSRVVEPGTMDSKELPEPAARKPEPFSLDPGPSPESKETIDTRTESGKEDKRKMPVDEGTLLSDNDAVSHTQNDFAEQGMHLPVASPPELQVHIANEDSGRSINLKVAISQESNMYDAIYDNPVVRAAGVRKWKKEIAKEVQDGIVDIHCVVLDNDGNTVRSILTDSLRVTTTKQLMESVPKPHKIIKLVLRWEKKPVITEKEENMMTPSADLQIRITNEATEFSMHFVVPISEGLNLYDGLYNNDAVLSAGIRRWPDVVAENVKNRTVEIRFALINDEGVDYSIEELKEVSTKELAETKRNMQGPIECVLRCRKMHATEQMGNAQTKVLDSGLLLDSPELLRVQVRLTNDLTGRFKDLELDVTDESNLFDNLYQNEGVLSANVRKWPKDVAQAVKNGSHEIRCVLLDQEAQDAIAFSVDDLKETTTNRLVSLSLGAQHPVKLVLRCGKIVREARENLVENEPDRTMEILVANEITEKFKFLEVPIGKDLSLFDSIYNSEELDSSDVRKFPQEVLQGVTYNTHEIKCVLCDSDGIASRLFTIDDLANTSTLELFEMTSKFDAPIKLVLRAQKKAAPFHRTVERRPEPPVDYSSLSFIRVQITNEATERVKALVLPVSPKLNLYEAMYDERTVKSSYISEMPEDVAQALQENKVEIKCLLLDEEGVSQRAFSLDALKSTSTRDIYELTEEHEGVIYFVLRCYSAVS